MTDSHTQRHNSLGIHGLHTHALAHNLHRLALFRRAKLLVLGLLLLLGIGAALVFFQRSLHAQELATQTRQNSAQHVSFTYPTTGRSEQNLQLPGTLQGFMETPVYARTSGYVSHWYKDIGDHVKAGELLAEISTVEVEQQLAGARATRAQNQSALQLARTSFLRWQALHRSDAVSQQEVDERQNAFKVAQANLDASEAEVQRLTQLVAYNRIVAPFAGVVTKRNLDVGTLVDAGNGGEPKLLYSIAQTDPLRVYIAVPQSDSPHLKAGIAARVTLTELPGESFAGKVVRSAGAIDPATRTLQVEVNLPNHDGRLLPGAYVEVALQVPAATQSVLTVPNNSLLFRAEGTLVATVDEHGVVHLHQVSLGRDLGARIELLTGVSATDRIIINPSDALADGDQVVASEQAAPATAAAAPAVAPASATGGKS